MLRRERIFPSQGVVLDFHQRRFAGKDSRGARSRLPQLEINAVTGLPVAQRGTRRARFPQTRKSSADRRVQSSWRAELHAPLRGGKDSSRRDYRDARQSRPIGGVGGIAVFDSLNRRRPFRQQPGKERGDASLRRAAGRIRARFRRSPRKRWRGWPKPKTCASFIRPTNRI